MKIGHRGTRDKGLRTSLDPRGGLGPAQPVATDTAWQGQPEHLPHSAKVVRADPTEQVQELLSDQPRLDELLDRQGLRYRATGKDFQHEAFDFLPAQANLHTRTGRKFGEAFRLELVCQFAQPGMGYCDVTEPEARCRVRLVRCRRSAHQ